LYFMKLMNLVIPFKKGNLKNKKIEVLHLEHILFVMLFVSNNLDLVPAKEESRHCTTNYYNAEQMAGGKCQPSCASVVTAVAPLSKGSSRQFSWLGFCFVLPILLQTPSIQFTPTCYRPV